MLPAYLPSWVQEISGSAMSSKLTEVMNASVTPLALALPLAIVALLFVDRIGGANRATAGLPPPDNENVQDRAALPALPAASDPWHTSSITPVAPISAVQPAAPLVLVVDDSAVVRAKLSRMLIGIDMRVIEACDGHEAWELISRGERPTVVITDLEMPVVDGFELIAGLHGAIETEHVPIIAITGRDDLRAQVADLCGIYGIFRKPWNDRELIRRIELLVAMTGATQAADRLTEEGIQARGRIAITTRY